MSLGRTALLSLVLLGAGAILAGSPAARADAPRPDAAPAPVWHELLPRAPLRVAAIGEGDAVLAGELGAPVVMAGRRLAGKGGTDLFVSRIDARGQHLWAEAFGGPGREEIAALAAGGEALAIAGTSEGGIDFGGGALGAGTFLAKLDGAGRHAWSKAIGVATVKRVQVDREGNVVALIRAEAPIDLGSGPIAASRGAFVAKLDGRGQPVWIKTYGEDVTMNDVGVTPAGEVIVVGGFRGRYDFGGGEIPSQGRDAILVGYGKDGSFQWNQRIGDEESQDARVLAVDADGSLFVHMKEESGPVMGLHKLGPRGQPLWRAEVAGRAHLAPDGTGGVVYGTRSPDSEITYLGRLDGRGRVVWERTMPESVGAAISDLTVTTSGLLLVVGRGSKGTDLGGGLILNPPAETSTDFVVAYHLDPPSA